MSLISRTAQYALRAMTLLAAQEGRITVKQLALAVGAPQPYLARIIMTLADVGLIDARRGPGGGLKLGRQASDISLHEVITCFDGDALFDECCLGLPGCCDCKEKCPTHDEWSKIREKISDWWKNTSLVDIEPEQTAQCMLDRIEQNPDEFTRNQRTRGRWH